MYVNVAPLFFAEKSNTHSLKICIMGYSNLINICGRQKICNFRFIFDSVLKDLIYPLLEIMNIDKILEGRDYTC